MKIKAYFVTYDNDSELNQTLKTFEKSGIKKYDYEITVINNFTALDITPDIVVKSPQWIMYPLFESKIPNLKDKNYINYEAQN